MGDIYQKIPPGSSVTKFSISVWNEMLGMLRWWKTHPGRTGSGPLTNLVDWDQNVFSIENASGTNIDEYAILGLSGPLFPPLNNINQWKYRTTLRGVAPVEGTHDNAFCVILEASNSMTIRKACVSGLVPVRLDVQSDTDPCAGIVDGDCTHLITGSTGAPVQWMDAEENEDANGYRWGLVLVGAAPASSTSWFQLIADNDGENYRAKGNPAITDPDTGFLYCENGDADNPEWTVMLIDSSGFCPCWAGDYVQASPIGVSIDGFEDYSAFQITSRASSQLAFWGLLWGNDLAAGGSAQADLIINGNVTHKTVHDGGLLAPGQLLPAYSPVRATYFPALRKFIVDAAPCQG